MSINSNPSKFFLLLAIIFFSFSLPQHFSYGQIRESIEQQEARLRAELAETEKEIQKWQGELHEKQKESASFERDIQILNAKIKEAQASIRAGQINIERLGREIDLKLQTIEELDDKIFKGKESLSQLIRKTNEINSFSMVEIMLSNEDLSEFLVDLDTFDSVNLALNSSFEEIRSAKSRLEVERQELKVRRDKEVDIKVSNESKKRQVEISESERKKLLNISRTQEKTYTQVISEKSKRAAQIRATLFALRDSAAIPFGDALEFATQAFKKTGVRPAFILAILTQESNLGANVGTCNRPQDTLKWRDIMPGPDDIAKGLSKRNDQAAYLRIVSKLGFDPETLPLSCPWGNGWGGAMGPSQFIPTTWEIYESKIATAVDKKTPNPWSPEDAITASAIYLGELGAGAGGYTAERTAALKYYAGGNWNKPKNAFYGDQVMKITTKIQEEMINPLLNI